jgi:hypothetical protein
MLKKIGTHAAVENTGSDMGQKRVEIIYIEFKRKNSPNHALRVT